MIGENSVNFKILSDLKNGEDSAFIYMFYHMSPLFVKWFGKIL